jgi:hypothetical protein
MRLAEQIAGRPVTINVVYTQRKQEPQAKRDESEDIIKKIFKGNVVKGE